MISFDGVSWYISNLALIYINPVCKNARQKSPVHPLINLGISSYHIEYISASIVDCFWSTVLSDYIQVYVYTYGMCINMHMRILPISVSSSSKSPVFFHCEYFYYFSFSLYSVFHRLQCLSFLFLLYFHFLFLT